MPLLANARSFLSFARAWLQVFSLSQTLAKRHQSALVDLSTAYLVPKQL